MPKVQLISQIEIDFDDVLQGVARLENSELEQFVEKVMALRAQRRAPNLPHDEAQLLQKINHGVPAGVRQRYGELNAKLLAEAITPAEQQELLKLTDQIELADAERMNYLIRLAVLRNVPVDELMEHLGIRRPPHG